MATYSIRHRWTRRELAAIEAPTYARALEWAARRGMGLADTDLAGTDLRGAFLPGSDLRGAGLAGADLSGGYLRRADLRRAGLRGARLAHAFLGAADLRGADLREADLSRADLPGTNLVGADLRGTILTGARLDGTLCDWRWSTIPAELLRQRLSPMADGSPLVVALAFHDDPAPWSWLKLIGRYGRLADGALLILARWVRDGDNAPDLLRSLSADAMRGRHDRVEAPDGPDSGTQADSAPQSPAPAELQAAPRMRWTRKN